MNYINRLQADNTTMRNTIDQVRDEILQFKMHLASAKFTGVDSDGSRKDWIATSDVLHRLAELDRVLGDGLVQLVPVRGANGAVTHVSIPPSNN